MLNVLKSGWPNVSTLTSEHCICSFLKGDIFNFLYFYFLSPSPIISSPLTPYPQSHSFFSPPSLSSFAASRAPFASLILRLSPRIIEPESCKVCQSVSQSEREREKPFSLRAREITFRPVSSSSSSSSSGETNEKRVRMGHMIPPPL